MSLYPPVLLYPSTSRCCFDDDDERVPGTLRSDGDDVDVDKSLPLLNEGDLLMINCDGPLRTIEEESSRNCKADSLRAVNAVNACRYCLKMVRLCWGTCRSWHCCPPLRQRFRWRNHRDRW